MISNRKTESNEGSSCDVENSVFSFSLDSGDKLDNKHKMDVDFLGGGWEWNKGEEIGYDDEVLGQG